MTAWFVHRSPWIWVVAVLVGVTVSVLPADVGEPFGWTVLAVAVAATFGSRRHDAGLCERCVDQWPPNGPELAERRALWLWLHHSDDWLPALLAKIAGVLLVVFVVPYEGRGMLAWNAMLLLLAAEQVAEIRHRQLLPWCPWCRRDDGDDQSADDPVPTADGTKVGPS